MSGTKRISGALAAVAMTGVVLGACVSPGADLGPAVRDENHLPAVVIPATRDTDKLSSLVDTSIRGGRSARALALMAAARAAAQAATGQEARANAARAAAQTATGHEAWANAKRAAAQATATGGTTRRMLPR